MDKHLLELYREPGQVGMTRLIIRKSLAQLAETLMILSGMEIRIEALKQNLSHAENFGHIIDPTGYRDLLQGGGFDAVKDEIAAADMMLSLIKLSKLIPSDIGPEDDNG